VGTSTHEAGFSGVTQEQVKELLTSLCNVKRDTAVVIDKNITQLKRELAEEWEAAKKLLAKKIYL